MEEPLVMAEQINVMQTSEPAWSKAYCNTTDVPWFLPNIDHKVTEETRTLLQTYSEISPSEVLEHVEKIRQKAWSIRSYPCTGLGLWLTPNIKRSHVYPVIIERLQSGASFLDVGCFLGQDLRALVVDGAPSNNLYGIDIVSHWELGYEMFRDREKFSARFIEGDILVPNAAMQDLAGKMDVISMMSMLHAWDWETQVRALKEVVKLSNGKGSMVVGFQVGSEGLRDRTGTHLGDSARVYWHSPTSFQEIWDQVGEETETKWTCESTLETFEAAGQPTEGMEWLGDDTGVFRFAVVRME